MATASQLKKMFEEFEDESNSKIKLYLDLAEKCIGTSKFGNKRDEAVLFLAAHFLAKTGMGEGATGSITKEKVGDLEVTYSNAMAQGSGAEYQTTPYGQMFWQLLRGCVITPMVAKC